MPSRRPKRLRRFMFTPLGQRWEDDLREHLRACTNGTPTPDQQAYMWSLARRAARMRNVTPNHLVVALLKELAKEGK